MDRYFISETEFGKTAIAILPTKDQVLQLFVGIDGSRSIQVHPFSHATFLVETGVSGLKPFLKEEIISLFTKDCSAILPAFLEGLVF